MLNNTDKKKESAPATNHKYLEGFDVSVTELLINQGLRAILPQSMHNQQHVTRAYRFLEACAPQSPLEAMLHIQLLGLHTHSMKVMEEANNTVSIDIKDKYLRIANKLTRTFATSLDALGKYKREGKQLIRIENVNVNQGGQAIVAGSITKN